MNCDTARIYCGAVADGELEAVPAAVLQHIRACHDCGTEVEWQREAQRATVAALASEGAARPVARNQRWRGSQRRPVRLAAVAAAVAVVTVGGVLAGLTRGAGDPGRTTADAAMGDAAHAYGRPAAYSSSDGAAIAGWSSGRGMPIEVMRLPGEEPAGARVSTVAGHQVMTIIYTGSHGTTEVTVVPSSMAQSWPGMEATSIDRVPVGLVRRTGASLIVVSPDDAGLHQVMSALQL